jgi:hypothetical protein
VGEAGEDLRELRDAVAGARGVTKSLIRTARSALGVLTDLEERLTALENAQPEEAQRDQHSRKQLHVA